MPSAFTWAVRCKVSMMYYGEFVLESCLWRGCISARDTYALGFLVTTKNYMAAAAESESMKQEQHTTLQHILHYNTYYTTTHATLQHILQYNTYYSTTHTTHYSALSASRRHVYYQPQHITHLTDMCITNQTTPHQFVLSL